MRCIGLDLWVSLGRLPTFSKNSGKAHGKKCGDITRSFCALFVRYTVKIFIIFRCEPAADTGNTDGLVKVFHILHRFIHRRTSGKRFCSLYKTVYIIILRALPENPHFFSCAHFAKGRKKPRKKVLDTPCLPKATLLLLRIFLRHRGGTPVFYNKNQFFLKKGLIL